MFNVVGDFLSETASFIFAAKPAAPALAPTDELLVTSSTQISVNYLEISDLEEAGGSPILSYNLQMDDSNGLFTDIDNSTMQLSQTITTGVIQG